MKTNRIMQSILMTLLFAGLFGNSFGQTKEISGVRRVSLNNFGEIIEGKEIKGYYSFYALDKVDKKNNSYVLGIFDANLNEVASENLVLPKHYYLLEASYNQENLLFTFYNGDKKGKEIVLRRYDKNAKFLGETKRDLDKWEEMGILQLISKDEIANARVFAIKSRGFVHLSMEKKKKLGYVIDYIPSNSQSRKWTYGSKKDSKEIEMASFLHYDAENGTVLFTTSKKPNLMSKKFDVFILGIDAQTGRKKFETKLEDSKYKIQIYNGYNNEETGKSKLVGAYFDQDGKMNDNSLGFCTFSLSAKGQMVDKKFVSWAKDVAKFLPMNQKGKMDKAGYFYIHNVISTQDGRIFVMAESYKKAVSAGGAALGVLAAMGGGRSTISSFKMVVGDLAIFEMDKDFNLKNAKLFDKTTSNILLPGGAGVNGAVMLGHFLKAYGGFDYSFTQSAKGNEGFVVGYQDYKKIKGDKNHWIFGAVSNMDGEYSTDEIDLRTENTALRVFPGKPGYVMVIELGKYDRKSKSRTISMRLEKVNY
jgi:hypothetical protein